MGKVKKLVITLLAVAVVGTGGFFGWRYLRGGNVQPVKVFPFDLVGMTEYWGDTQESYGPVSTDQIQTVYLSDTQTVSQILVEDGQEVKKGDLLLSFDTTLSQLELERKDLEIQKLQLDLEDANKELQRISWMVPMRTPPTEPETQPTVPSTVMFRNGDYSLFRENGHDGSSREAAMICWIPMGKVISTEFLQEQIGELLPETGEEPTEPETEPSGPDETTNSTEVTNSTEESNPTEETPSTETSNPVEVPDPSASEESTESSVSGEEALIMFTAFLSDEPTETWETTTEATTEATTEPSTEAPAEVPTEAPTEPSAEVPTVPADPSVIFYGIVVCDSAVSLRSGPGTAYPVVDYASNGQQVAVYELIDVNDVIWCGIGGGRWICMDYIRLDGSEVYEPTAPSAPTEPEEEVEPAEPGEKRCRPYYVVFKVTENNYLRGNVLVWLGVHVRSDGSFSFFDARNVEDISLPPEPPEETEPDVDYIGSGYTYSQIQEMKKEQEQKIKDLDIQLKLAQAELKIMERELSDGNVYSEQDGKVISLLTEEEAKLNSQPIIKVSGGGGYYVDATVNELERDNVFAGMEVTVMDWESGGSYTGTVVSVGDIPSSGGMDGMSNPNASSYPMKVFVEEDANLREGGYVSVQYSSASQGGIYLQNPFLRTIQGRSFVYVLGQDGLLEERTVTVGKSLGGSYTEILEGLTAEDLVAFPYGKNVKPGVPAEEGDMSDLYN